MNVDIKEIEIADYDIIENIKTALYRLWKAKIYVVLMTALGAMLALIYIGVVGIRINYQTSATIYSMVYGSYEDSADGVAVMNTYAGLLGSSSVCDRAAASLQRADITGATLKNMVSQGRIYLSGASSNSKSYGYKLTLVTVASSPEKVIEISNAMANAFVDEINELLGTKTLQVMDEAVRYSTMQSINVMLYIILFALVGFVGTCGVIFVKEFFSARVYSVAQCEPDKELILGMIPYDK